MKRKRNAAIPGRMAMSIVLPVMCYLLASCGATSNTAVTGGAGSGTSALESVQEGAAENSSVPQGSVKESAQGNAQGNAQAGSDSPAPSQSATGWRREAYRDTDADQSTTYYRDTTAVRSMAYYRDTTAVRSMAYYRDTTAVRSMFPDTIPVSGELELRTGANLDSLLNLWYVNQALEDAVDRYDPLSESVIPDFPDSVYLDRLAEIPCVIDLTYNRIVKNYINVYTRERREQMRIMLGLSEYYFPMFEEIFDLYSVPYELKYLSVIESALNPRAVSRAGAVGAWQFMYRTGRHYGLTINSLVDERRDPVAATHAAARFLTDLYRMYGDWTMALAAYNCGPGNVNKAIRRSGGKRDFWDIYYFLPRETRGYVPAFIAATYAMNYYEDHLLSPAPLELPRYTDTIRVHEPVHLKQIAGVLGIPIGQLRDMNPQYRADVVPATGSRSYAIKLPLEMSAAFIDLQDSIFAYKDSVYFDPGKMVATPQRYSASYRVDLPADKYDKLIYTVRSGDNVGYIADWYDVRASDLRYWNNIRRNLIRTGQKLLIYKPKGRSERYRDINNMGFAEKQRFAGRAVPSSSAGGSASSGKDAQRSPDDRSEYVTYRVRQGDTLWEIARQYPGISETDIARLNNLTNAAKIKPGQILRIKRKG